MNKFINLTKQIESQLSKDITEVLKLCSQAAFEYEYKIYLIGGVVRDLFLNKPVKDIDITVEGNAIRFCHELVKENICKIIQVQENLKTAKVVFNNGVEIDFASTRQEFYPKRGHLPVVSKIGCTLEEDVFRRDFTINSLAISLNENSFGEVIDYVGGIKDLEQKILKVLHDNSFYEDPSRIIRGLKFAARFDLHRDKHTRELQDKYLETQLSDDISWARIKSELKQTFSLNIARAFDMFIANNTYKLVKAKPVDVKGLEIKNLVDKFNPEHVWLVYLGMVLEDEKIINALCFTRAEKKIFTDKFYLLNNELNLINTNYDIYKFFEKRSTEAVLIYYLLTERKEALIYLEKLAPTRVELCGEDLKKFGVPAGKKIGIMLEELLKNRLSGNIKTKADEVKFVKSKVE